MIEPRYNATQSRGWINGSAEPLLFGRRLLLVGKGWESAPTGLLGVEEHGMLKRNGERNGEGLGTSQYHLYGKATRITNQGSRGVGRDWQLRS